MMWRLTAFLTVLLAAALECQAQGPSYIAEGYFVVDDEVVQRYIREVPGTGSAAAKRTQALASLNQDIEYFLTEINNLLSTLQASGLDIQIKKRSVEILSSNIFDSGFLVDGVVLAKTALESFEAWLGDQNSHNTLNFDFAILWTGYNLYGERGLKSIGSSFAGKICEGNMASGVVEFNGYFATAIHTARYIAYILGASDDGPAIKNIMSILLSPDDEDRWEFSSCSASDILAQIPSASCLLVASSESTTPSSSYASYAGSIFDPDVICQRTLNDSRSYMCKMPSVYDDQNPSGDTICRSIACWIFNTSTCVTTFPSEGLVCNPNGICDDGTCIADSSPRSSNVVADCVHGDQKRLFFPALGFNGTCAELVGQYGKDVCYDDDISTVCCATCNDVCDGPAGCKCGDRSTVCGNYPKSLVCPAFKDTLCCGHCEGFKKKRSIFGTEFDASLVLEVKDPVKGNITYEVIHESIIREVE